MVLLRKDVDNMKMYEKPNMEILLLNDVEVITASTTNPVLSDITNGGTESTTDWSDLISKW